MDHTSRSGTVTKEKKAAALAAGQVSLARHIAYRLRRRYHWVDVDELEGYAYLGIALAARHFDSTRGVPFDRFASYKGMFLAIDEMRKDGVVRHCRAKAKVSFVSLPTDLPGRMPIDSSDRLEAQDFCRSLLRKLKPEDRHLLHMYYSDGLTFKEIARVLEITESAVSLRRKALLARLRKLAHVRRRF